MLILSICFLAIFGVGCNAVKCYDKQNAKVNMPGSGWVETNEDHGFCASGTWCAKVDVDGSMTGPAHTLFDVNGAFAKCVDSLSATRSCNDIGNGCKTVSEFLEFKGVISVCCCDSDLCNGGEKIAFSFALFVILITIALNALFY